MAERRHRPQLARAKPEEPPRGGGDAALTRLLDDGPAASCLGCWDLYKKLRRFDVPLFKDAIDFFQNGGAGWKHARRSDWNVSNE